MCCSPNGEAVRAATQLSHESLANVNMRNKCYRKLFSSISSSKKIFIQLYAETYESLEGPLLKKENISISLLREN